METAFVKNEKTFKFPLLFSQFHLQFTRYEVVQMELNYYTRLRELREDHDYSQADIGKRLGMSNQQYFLYEKGYRDIPTHVLIALAKL